MGPVWGGGGVRVDVNGEVSEVFVVKNKKKNTGGGGRVGGRVGGGGGVCVIPVSLTGHVYYSNT